MAGPWASDQQPGIMAASRAGRCGFAESTNKSDSGTIGMSRAAPRDKRSLSDAWSRCIQPIDVG
jgi:hypothetical protein